MTEIRLPQFGMGMTDGTIIAWHKAAGETVAKGELLCTIEAAKTTVEYESPLAGTVARILVPLDHNVPVNTPIVDIDESGLAAPAIAAVAEQADVPPRAPAPPHAAGEAKATPLARRLAQQAGIDLAAVAGSGANGRICRNDVTGASAAAPATARPVQIEPRARQAARDLGVDLAAVTGSGPGERIVAEDVIAVAEAIKAPPPPPAAASAEPAEPAGHVEIRHSMMRRTIAQRLTKSKQTVPHFYLKASCRIDALLAARQAINVAGQEKVSVNDLLVRAIAMALVEVPQANVTWDEKAMRQYDHVDIAVAVATPRGLVTPVVRNVEAKTIRHLAAEVKELAGRGREGKLQSEEYEGGTTASSNLGMYGVEEFSAIINPPHSTIFAIGAGEQRVVPIEGVPAVAMMMTVTLSCDHRAIDGAVGAELLRAFKAIVENPVRILA